VNRGVFAKKGIPGGGRPAVAAKGSVNAKFRSAKTRAVHYREGIQRSSPIHRDETKRSERRGELIMLGG